MAATTNSRDRQIADLHALSSELGITLTSVDRVMNAGEFDMGDLECLVVQYGSRDDLMHMRDVSYLSVTYEFGCNWDWSGPEGIFWFLSRAPYRRAIPYSDLPDLIVCMRRALERRAVDPNWRREFA